MKYFLSCIILFIFIFYRCALGQEQFLRNNFSLDFAPAIWTIGIVPIAVNSLLKPYPGIGVKPYTGIFSTRIAYTFGVSKRVAIYADIGITIFDLSLSANIPYSISGDNINNFSFNVEKPEFPYGAIKKRSGYNTANSQLDSNLYYTGSFIVLPMSIGIRFYFSKEGDDYGFFLMPKVGLTVVFEKDFTEIDRNRLKKDGIGYLVDKGLYDSNLEKDIDRFLDEKLDSAINDPSLGVYAGKIGRKFNNNLVSGYLSLELGWKIKLFPNASKNWRVKPVLEISVLDIGYYFSPYIDRNILYGNTGTLMDSLKKYGGLANLRLIPLSRISLGIAF